MAIPAYILRLPDELLADISSLLVDRDKVDLFDTHGEAEQQVVILRQVCRRFCNASSHLLLRYVKVGINAKSLTRLKSIIQHPLIGKGVKGLHIDVRCHGENTAKSIQNFSLAASRRLVSCLPSRARQDSRQRSMSEERNKEDIDALLRSWVPINKAVIIATRKYSDDQMVLYEAFMEYQKAYKEQEQLRENDNFFRSLDAIFSGNSNITSFHLRERMTSSYVTPWTIVDHPVLLRQMLSEPFTCWEAECLGEVETTLNEMFFKLPLALQSANILPTRLDFYRLDVEHYPKHNQSPDFLSNTKSSLSNLRETNLRIAWNEFYPEHEPSEQIPELLRDYIHTLLSAPKLEKATVDFNHYFDDHGPIDYSLLALVLPDCCPQLQILHLVASSFYIHDLENLLSAARYPMIQELVLRRPQLLDGNWEIALDKLRARGLKHFELADPRGADFDDIEPFLYSSMFDKNPDMSKATSYVLGLASCNPLEQLERSIMHVIEDN